MVRVLILAPFRYIYGHKNFWVTTGESMFLDQANQEEREELKYVLSPASEYSRWLWVDETQLDSNLLLDLKQGQQGQTVEDFVGNEVINIPNIETDLTAPAQEPEESPFLNPEIHQVVEVAEELIQESEAAEAVEVTETPEVVEVTLEQRKAAREAELQDLHWKRLEKLAATYGIDYQEKDQAIQEILAKEFE